MRKEIPRRYTRRTNETYLTNTADVNIVVLRKATSWNLAERSTRFGKRCCSLSQGRELYCEDAYMLSRNVDTYTSNYTVTSHRTIIFKVTSVRTSKGTGLSNCNSFKTSLVKTEGVSATNHD